MPGLTAEGFETRSLAAIIADFEAYERANIDPAVDTSETGLVGNFNGIMGARLAQLWELGQAIYKSLDPDQATDEALDAVAALTSTQRKPATKSRVRLTLSIDAGATVPAGSVVSVEDDASVRFVTLASVTNAGDATDSFAVDAECEVTGPVVALSGTLTVIETPVAGWVEVTNNDDATLGTDVEKDADLRVRREKERASVGGGTFDGLRADLLQVEGVEFVQLLENTLAYTNADGLPPHSFQAIVLVDSLDAYPLVAAAIWNDKPLGIRPYASAVNQVSVDVIDSQGNAQTVVFNRPVERRVFAAVTLVTGDDFAGNEAVRAAMIAAVKTKGEPGFWGIGVDAYASRLLCAALDVDGVLDAQVGISFTGIIDPNDGDSSLDIGTVEIATLESGDIYIPEG